jgi:ATP-dependent helicase IRC3
MTAKDSSNRITILYLELLPSCQHAAMISALSRGALTALRRSVVTTRTGGSTCLFPRALAASRPYSSKPVDTHVQQAESRSGPVIPRHVPDVQERSTLANPPFTSTSAPQSSITLRPYQHAAVAACLDALSSGLFRIGVSSPTGSGKTTMFMSLIPRVRRGYQSQFVEEGDGVGNENRNGSEGGGGDGDGTLAAGGDDGFEASGAELGLPLGVVHPETSHHGQTLIVVSSVELASQAEAAAQRLLGEGWSIEVEQGKRQASGYADV